MKNTIYAVFIIIIAIIIFILVNTILYTVDNALLNKYNIVIQGISTLTAAVLVMLSLSTLYVSKKQLANAARPYIIPKNIMLLDDERNELDFEILNIGVGTAYKVKVDIINMKDGKAFVHVEYPRISVTDNDLSYQLYGIINAIRELKKENNNGSKYSEHREPDIYEEIVLEEPYKDYYNIKFNIMYEDIYGNKYKNIMECRYSEDELYYYLISEKSIEA